MRLCLCGEVFFQDGYFPVNVRTIKDGDFLFDIKTNPQKYTKEDTVKLMDEYEKDWMLLIIRYRLFIRMMKK